MSHDDSGNGLFGFLYRTIKKQNLNNKKRLLRQVHPKAKNILDIGCGTGDFLNTLKAQYTVTGVEINDKAATLARAKNLTVHASLEEIQDKYDIITLWHVFEHMPHPSATLEKIKSLLNPEGILIIALPNFRSYDAQYYQAYWAAYDVPRHFWHFDLSSLSSLASSVHLKVVNFLPMYWDAYYVSLLSEKYRKSFLAPLRATLVGTLSNLKAWKTREASSLIYILK